MDELLRRAAEEYGLNPGKSNWDELSKALEYKTVTTSIVKEKSNRERYTAALVLAMFFLFTCNTLNKSDSTALNNEHNKSLALTGQKINGTEEKSTKNEVAIAAPDHKKISYNPHENIEQGSSEKPLITSSKNLSISFGAEKIISTSMNQPDVQQKNTTPDILSTDEKGNAATIEQKDLLITGQATPVAKPDVVKAEGDNKQVPTKNAKENIVKKQNGFYAGILVGTSVDAVKNQGIRKPGFDIGILAGYRLNNKTAVETGLRFAEKNYYSNGKYFSMNKVGQTMPQGMQVLSLEGSSQLLEIPLSIKHNLLQKKNNTVYASAGITSYLLLKEKNNYLALYNGVKQNIKSTYSNSSEYFAASIDVSAGYEFTTGKKNTLRIEPFVQIPLKGIGVGSLPVTSTGLRLAFSIPHR